MASVLDVASYFIAKGADSEPNDISNLKLQKLLYYAQGFYLAINERPLFNEDLEAWTHGPVSPDAYQKYKSFGGTAIDPPDSPANTVAPFTPDDLELLDDVYGEFGQYSAWKLREMTHTEKPWRDHEASASVIPHATLRDYFETRIR